MTEKMMNDSERTGLEVAVIGLAGRFPGANDIEQYWENLKNGVESITFFTEEELRKESYIASEILTNPHYIKAKGSLEDLESFDAYFFGYTPEEAKLMDPQFRLFHECVYEALQDAGYSASSYKGLIGLYAGSFTNYYWLAHILPRMVNPFEQFTIGNLNDPNTLSTRISYKLNLKGPSFTVQTSCSTSLVAIHLACQALINGECNIALAGGVAISLPKKTGYLYQEGMLHSKDGHCRAFDAEASGTVFGDGAGVVALKMLENAIADGDHIYAVVKGSAINNDGNAKVGFTAPSTKGQAFVIRAAQHIAEVEPESIGYIEAHGTGTMLGDPIEVEALKMAFNTAERNYCGIGSVKSNIGHLNNAAGVAGFMKTVLALKNKQIPPSLHYQQPNPKIQFDHSPFYVVNTLTEWKREKYPRRAGVSSFGVGGTNAHIILEEAPQVPPSSPSREKKLLVLSAKTMASLDQATQRLALYLHEHADCHLADVAYTLQTGRDLFHYRRMLVCSSVEEAINACTLENEMNSTDVRKLFTTESKKDPSVVFMLSGQGSQYVNMGLELYQKEPFYQEQFDACAAILQGFNIDIKKILYPETGILQAQEAIAKTEVTQPLMFAFEYALAKLLIYWGIEPDAMIGYSFGEYVAACLAGVISLEDALKLVAARGRLMQQMPVGAMLSVPLSEEKLTPLLNEEISIAVVNGSSCIVAGSKEAIERFEKEMNAKRLLCMRIRGSHGGHSLLMDSILDEFTALAKGTVFHQPTIPYISNITGEWIRDEEATDPAYWARHMRETVRFADGIQKLAQKSNVIFIEIGPGRDLSAMIGRFIDQNEHIVLNTIRPAQQEQSDLHYLLDRVGKLWAYGVKVDWAKFYAHERRQRVALPTYCFERQRYWIEGDPLKGSKAVELPAAGLNQKTSLENWFYLPVWKLQHSAVNPERLQKNATWLVFVDELGVGLCLAERLREESQKVVIVRSGNCYASEDVDQYVIHPGQKEDYAALIRHLIQTDQTPEQILHLWNLTDNQTHENDLYRDLQNSFYSLLYLVQALGCQNVYDEIGITVISNHLSQVTGQETLCPAKAPLIGACTVIPQEYPHITCKSIDIDLPQKVDRQLKKRISQIFNEILTTSSDPLVAYRNGNRWVRSYERMATPKPEKEELPIREQGVYLITGGLGRIGLELAQYLAEVYQARLILTSRSGVDSEAKAERIRQIEALGGKVLTLQADVTDERQMRDAINQAEEHFGPIHGLIHTAGIVGSQAFIAIKETEEADCDQQFQAKIHGLYVLNKVLQHKELDFCLMTSSLTSVLGGLGHLIYSAANLFVDHFVQYHNQISPNHWVSVNWDFWRFTDEVEQGGYFGKTAVELAMTPQEGCQIFQYLLSWTELDQVVISTDDLTKRIEQWVKLQSLRHEPNAIKQPVLNQRPTLSTPYVAPRTRLEENLLRIWQSFFGLEQIGVKDDFFELGGDSLKAITVASLIHKELNKEILLMDFFGKPSIEKLAEYINSHEQADYPIIRPIEEKESYALSSAQKRFFVLHQFDKSSTRYNTTVAVKMKGHLELELVEKAFAKLIERHESLRTGFWVINGQPVQKIEQEVTLKPEYIELQEDELNGVIKEFIRPFDLSQAPLLRVKVIKVTDQRNTHVLLIDLHHIISDGISVEILKGEFAQLYKGRELPPLQIQYKDFAVWQNELFQTDIVKKQEDYWLNQFKGKIPVLKMPTDFPRPAIQSFVGERVTAEINEELTKGLKKIAFESGATLYMTLLAVYTILLAKYTMQDDIVIGLPIAGRTQAEFDNVIGMFVNMLALRNRVGEHQTFSEFLLEVRKNALHAYENQDYQFEELVRKLNLERQTDRNPLFDTVFVLQNMENTKVEIDDLQLIAYDVENHTTIFDLYMQAVERNEKILLRLDYASALFKFVTVEKLLQRFIEIVKQVTECKDILIQDITLTHDFIESELSIPEMDFDFS